MIRISSILGDSRPVIKIAGHLESHHLSELAKLAGDRVDALVLDVSELQSADAESVQWLKGRLHEGGRGIGRSPYIACLLERAEARAVTVLEGLIRSLGYTDVTVVVGN